MLDVVYILGKGSHWRNNEIRYSLRSLERYVPHRNVYIVGECPEWARNVIHIEAVDGFPHKLKNAIHKIRQACFAGEMSEKFVLMNDDFFFLKPNDLSITYHLGSVNTAISNHKTHGGYYFEALNATRDVLQEASINNPINYEVHYPMIIDRRLFLRATNVISWFDIGYVFRSIYGNIYSIGGKKREDVKAYHLEDFLRLRDGDLLSISDRIALAPQFQRWIMERFPQPSKYEDPNTTPESIYL